MGGTGNCVEGGKSRDAGRTGRQREEGGAAQGQSGRRGREQTEGQAQGLVQPASLPKKATSCGAETTGVSGGLGPDSWVQAATGRRGSDLGNSHPSSGFLCYPCAVYCWGAKDLCSHGPWESPRLPYLCPPALTEGGAAYRRSPPGRPSHNHGKGRDKGHCSRPGPGPTPHGPGPAPPIHPVLKSLQSQVPSRAKALRPPVPPPPFFAQTSSSG